MSKRNRVEYKGPAKQLVESAYTVAMKPRPGLLVFFAVLFALWTGLLIYLYFTTVHR